MPGYLVTAVGRVNPSLLCPECELILKEAVQTYEGIRLCKECFENISREKNCTSRKTGICVRYEEDDDCFPDRAVRREILHLEVYCRNRSLGCSWKGKLGDYKGHEDICESSTFTLSDVENSKEDCVEMQFCANLIRKKLLLVLNWFDTQNPNQINDILRSVCDTCKGLSGMLGEHVHKDVLFNIYVSRVSDRNYLAESTRYLLRALEVKLSLDGSDNTWPPVLKIEEFRQMLKLYEAYELEVRSKLKARKDLLRLGEMVDHTGSRRSDDQENLDPDSGSQDQDGISNHEGSAQDHVSYCDGDENNVEDDASSTGSSYYGDVQFPDSESRVPSPAFPKDIHPDAVSNESTAKANPVSSMATGLGRRNWICDLQKFYPRMTPVTSTPNRKKVTDHRKAEK